MTFVSVVIPTRNRASHLARVLEALNAQDADIDSFETIVIDNGSTDETASLCAAHGRDLRNFKYEYDERPGLHIGRHRGLELARGEIILYGDDDIIPERTWVGAVADAFSDESVGLVGGPSYPEYVAEPPAWISDLIVETTLGWYLVEFSLVDLGDETFDTHPGLIFGCNLAARKDLISAVGGFHPDALPPGMLEFRGDGEMALAEKIAARGYRALYVPDAAVAHYVSAERMTIDYIRERSFAEGVSTSYRRVRRLGVPDKPWIPAPELVRSVIRSWSSRSKALRARWAGRAEGFRWHQRRVRSDVQLREWICQPNYFGDAGDLSTRFTARGEN